MSLALALTGGIASGKSAAAQCFAELGVPVLDADVCARDLVAPGQPALAEIAAHFGASVLAPDGTLNRAALRALVFDDAGARRALESILHPRIEAALHAGLGKLGAPYVVIVIPLLAEVGRYPWLERIVVVDACPTLQRERLIARDHIPAALADRMIAAQASRSSRLAIADDVLTNSGPRSTMNKAVKRLHAWLLARSAAHGR